MLKCGKDCCGKGCPDRDPTSPELLLAKNQLELMAKQEKQIELSMVSQIIHIAGVLIQTVLFAIIAMAVVVMSLKG